MECHRFAPSVLVNLFLYGNKRSGGDNTHGCRWSRHSFYFVFPTVAFCGVVCGNDKSEFV